VIMIPETMLTYPEAERRYKCDRKAIRKAVISGLIVTYKLGKAVLIDQDSADNWFATTRQTQPARTGRPRRGAKR